MKKNWILILSVFLVCGLGFIGCDTGNGTTSGGTTDDGTTSGGNTEPKTIVIEGIQDYTNQGSIRVFSDLNNVTNHQPVYAGIGYGSIDNGKLSVELTVPQDNTGISETKWTGNGNYYIYFMPRVNNSYSTVYGRIYMGDGTTPLKYAINESEITLSYSSFKTYNVWKD
jgi:hypothetical protein